MRIESERSCPDKITENYCESLGWVILGTGRTCDEKSEGPVAELVESREPERQREFTWGLFRDGESGTRLGNWHR